MSLTTDELREALHAYADDVAAPDPARMVAGAEHKRKHTRKVRAAVIAGAAAVLMAVVTVIGIQGIGHEKALTPAQLNKKHHTHYAAYTHGLKLTDIVDVPVRKVDDPNNAAPAKNAAKVTLPEVGSTVYVACEASAIVDSKDDEWTEIQLRSSGNTFTSCRPGSDSLLGGAKSGAADKLWAVTDRTPKVAKAAIAIYTQVDWKSYPARAAALQPKPASLSTKSPNGEHHVTFGGVGSTSVSRTVRVPASLAQGAEFDVAPSSTGRFQVLVDGKVQRLNYTGLPAKNGGAYGWIAPGVAPEVRDTWYDYWPDSGTGNVLGSPATIGLPRSGQTARITIRAVDTKGPWRAMLTWQKK